MLVMIIVSMMCIKKYRNVIKNEEDMNKNTIVLPVCILFSL